MSNIINLSKFVLPNTFILSKATTGNEFEMFATKLFGFDASDPNAVENFIFKCMDYAAYEINDDVAQFRLDLGKLLDCLKEQIVNTGSDQVRVHFEADDTSSSAIVEFI